MQLYIIRHAQSENNAIWTSTGSDNGRVPDPVLTKIGHRQARIMAEYIQQVDVDTAVTPDDPYNHQGFHLTHLYCSLMRRAVQTGTYLSRALDLPLVAWPVIHEGGGIYEKNATGERVGLPGPNRAYFAQYHPELRLPEELDEAGWWNRPVETWEEMPGRAQRFLDELYARHGDSDDRVAIVTHGGFYYAFFSVLLDFWRTKVDFGGELPIWFKVFNTSITRIDFNDDHVSIIYPNRADFLPPELLT